MKRVELTENLIEQAIEAGENGTDTNYVKGGLAASFINSIGRSLVFAHATLLRYDDPEDPFFGQNGRLTADQRADRIKRQEQRIDELAETLSWLAQYASAEVTPTGQELVNRAVIARAAAPRPVSDEEIKATAEFHEIDEADVRAALAADRLDQEQRQELARRALEGHEVGIARLIDRALSSHANQDFELSPWDAVSIMERMATKCGEYATKRFAYGIRQSHPTRKQQSLTEAKLLKEVSKKAAELEQRFRTDAENATDRAPVEEQAAAVA